jgi:STE24 endopeptidase
MYIRGLGVVHPPIVRLILIIALFLIWQGWSPDAQRFAVFTPQLGMVIFAAGYWLLIVGTRWWAVRLARGMTSGGLGNGVRRFNFGMDAARWLIPLWFAAGVFLLGWRHVVDALLRPWLLLPVEPVLPGTLIGLLPGLLAWMGLWWSQFPVDRAMREHNVLYLLEADLPVFAPPEFRDYFVNKLRTQLLFVTVPVFLILLLRDLGVLAAASLAHTPMGRGWGLRLPLPDTVETAVSFAAAIPVMVFAPAIVRHILHTQRMPESRLRRSLTTIAENTGVACREILLWRTQNNLGNAAVMGLIPRVRFVMLSDLLLESMTDLQIQAVFAHELGHVKHRHLMWFVAFFVTASTALFAATAVLEGMLHLNEHWKQMYDLFSMLGCAVVLIVAYGFISRWFERQADVFAARTIQQWGKTSQEKTPVAESLPVDFGAAVFASSLERVAVVNNIPIEARNWTHGSIESRIRYVRKFGKDPEIAARFDRKSRAVVLVLSLVIITCGIAIAVAGTHGISVEGP